MYKYKVCKPGVWINHSLKLRLIYESRENQTGGCFFINSFILHPPPAIKIL